MMAGLGGDGRSGLTLTARQRHPAARTVAAVDALSGPHPGENPRLPRYPADRPEILSLGTAGTAPS